MAKRASKRSKRTSADLVPASAIAKSVKKSLRAVQLWAKRKDNPCPSHEGRGANNKPTRLFVEAEVFAWMDRHGLDRPNHAPRSERVEPRRQVDAPAQQLTGNASYDWYIEYIYSQIQELANQPVPKDAGAAHARTLSQALKNLSTEYRSLVRDGGRIREITAGWTQTDLAIRSVSNISRVLGTEVDALEAELPASVVEDFIRLGLVDPSKRDDGTRAIAKLLATRIGRLRTTGRQITTDVRGAV